MVKTSHFSELTRAPQPTRDVICSVEFNWRSGRYPYSPASPPLSPQSSSPSLSPPQSCLLCPFVSLWILSLNFFSQLSLFCSIFLFLGPFLDLFPLSSLLCYFMSLDLVLCLFPVFSHLLCFVSLWIASSAFFFNHFFSVPLFLSLDRFTFSFFFVFSPLYLRFSLFVSISRF